MAKKQQQYPSDFTPDRKRKPDNDDMRTAAHHVLTLTPLTPEQRAKRDAEALGRLKERGAEDLAEMLGLTEPPKVEVVISGPKAVPCPQCQAVPGVRCVSSRGKFLGQAHRSRCRRAEAVRAGRQTEELTKESA